MKLKKFFDIANGRTGVIDESHNVINEAHKLGDDEIDYDMEEDNFHTEEFPEEDDIQPDEDYSDDLNDDDLVEALLSTLRKMIRNSNFNKAYVFRDDEGCINIQFVLNKTEKMSGIMKVMNLLKKFESDILIQYESEFDLWESKEGDPILTGKFFYDEGVSSDSEEDEEPPF